MNFRIEREAADPADPILPRFRGVLVLAERLEPVVTPWRAFWSPGEPAEPEIAAATLAALEAHQTKRAADYRKWCEMNVIPSFVGDLMKRLNQSDAEEYASALRCVLAHFAGDRSPVVAYAEGAHPDGRVYSVRFDVNDHARGKRFAVQCKQGTETVFMTNHATYGAAVHAVVKHLHGCRGRLEVTQWDDRKAMENYRKLGELDSHRRRRQEEKEAAERQRQEGEQKTAAEKRAEHTAARERLVNTKTRKPPAEAFTIQGNAGEPTTTTGERHGFLWVAKNADSGKGYAVYTAGGLLACGHARFGTFEMRVTEARRWAVWLAPLVKVEEPDRATLERCVAMFKAWNREEFADLERMILENSSPAG